METTTLVIGIVAGVLSIPLLGYVHYALERHYVRIGVRYCTKHGYEISRCRCGPEFDDRGVKTEYFIVEFDCISTQGTRQRVKLRVWILGVRKVLGIEDISKEETD